LHKLSYFDYKTSLDVLYVCLRAIPELDAPPDASITEFELRHHTCPTHVSKIGNLMSDFSAPLLTMAPYVIDKAYSDLDRLQVLHAGFFDFSLIGSVDLKKPCIYGLI
jgi:hypothetical protein